MKSDQKKSTHPSCYCPCCGYRSIGINSYAERSPWPGDDLDDLPLAGSFGEPFHEGCHCCGYEFVQGENIGACGQAISLETYRKFWIKDGCRWFYGDDPRPKNWSIAEQLAAAGIPFEK